jgi:hypothetical protein
MSRRKLVAAALFFTLFGAIAFLPPFALLFRHDTRVAGVPLETAYVFAVWILLIVGARWFSRVLPDDTPPSADTRQDRPS